MCFRLRALTLFLASFALSASADPVLSNSRYALSLREDGSLRLSLRGSEAHVSFRPDFTVLMTREDPKLAMRPGDLPNEVSYNVLTWESRRAGGPAGLEAVKRTNAQGGDGFDDRILDASATSRTADLFQAGDRVPVVAQGWTLAGDEIRYVFTDTADFSFSAAVSLPAGDAEPVLKFTLAPKTAGYFSVGYTGAPITQVATADALWQPFLWQEKRFPHRPFLTPAFQCPVPATFVRQGGLTFGVVADAREFPFDPLPTLENSRFGVALRNLAADAQPMVFAPILGGPGSARAPGETFDFTLRLFASAGDITVAYEEVARRLYGFHDYRQNAITTLNATLDRMIDYGLSDYSWFVYELKGCAYSTDVPGAVKNVSSLNPLNLALVADDETIFQRRAYPIIEYLLSREKFLFSLDPRQKIQSPSRLLRGPAAPVSELATLYGITDGASPVFRTLAEEMLTKSRVLNLDDVTEGDTWENHLHVYRATGDARNLAKARAGADAYLADRMKNGASDFDRAAFFFTSFAPKWIALLELFEATQDRRYLEAARQGARHYAMFTWAAPSIPDADVTVNAGGKAPWYWYLKRKGHPQMLAPEERVPAWRVSEIGLTPESSGTMSGHRAIFMANFAPWMLRIAAHTGDALLHDVARSAVVGRYRNFPGYHMNTARTTVYEQADYPLRPHRELSMNSFHYNHIWPNMSILLDYLVTDAFARSKGRIDFPSRFIEGYAYLQSKFYGDRPGIFYGRDDATLWMPRSLLDSGHVELNYLTARGEKDFYIALTNQSRDPVTSRLAFNPEVFAEAAKGEYRVTVIADGRPAGEATLRDGSLEVTVSPMGITALVVEGLRATPKFQQKLLATAPEQAWKNDSARIAWGVNTRAMILNFGPVAKTAYVYLEADDSLYRSVSLDYEFGETKGSATDDAFPFEFTVPLGADTREFRFRLRGVGPDGATSNSPEVTLSR